MSNVRGLYPPLYGATPSGGGGGGGGGQHIQVDTLPEASLANKDKIVQYVGATTETLTNAYFYKCVENTGYEWEETEASETYTEAETLPTASAETIGTIYKVDDKYYQTIIVLTYSWNSVDVMYVPTPTISFDYSDEEVEIGTVGNDKLYRKGYTLSELAESNSYLTIDNNLPIKEIIKVEGNVKFTSGVSTQYPVPFYESSGTFINVMYEYSQLRVRNGASLHYGTAHIFVYYTKTT